MMTSLKVCTFFVGPHALCLEVGSLREVVPCEAVASVPLAPTVVRGLVNLRGEVLVVVDGGLLWGVGALGLEGGLLLIIESQNDTFALLVERVGDVVDMEDTILYNTPATLPDARKLLRGVYRTPSALLLSVDPQQVVQAVIAASPGGAP